MANRPIVASYIARSLARAVKGGAISEKDAETVARIVGEAAFGLDRGPDSIEAGANLDRLASRALSDFVNSLEAELEK